ncbi:MAG: hypothetical protein ACLS36_06850 [Streptococcus sp.]
MSTVYLNKGLYVYRESQDAISDLDARLDDDLGLCHGRTLAIVASHGFPLEKYMVTYRQMLEACLKMWRSKVSQF